MNYDDIIQEFLDAMSEVEAPVGEYIDALYNAKHAIETAIDAAKEDLAEQEE